MFYSDLLLRRDSGIGLLWLAANLGPNSSLKKLPRRSILSADVSQLCTLLSQPPEPLSLRLQSSLMIGVVRVYRVKSDILFSDAANCVSSLRKTLLLLHDKQLSSIDATVANIACRAEALNTLADPIMDLELEFGMVQELYACGSCFTRKLVLMGDSPLNIALSTPRRTFMDIDFTPPSDPLVPATPLSNRLHLLNDALQGLGQEIPDSELNPVQFDESSFGNDFFAFDNGDIESGQPTDWSDDIARGAGGSWLSAMSPGKKSLDHNRSAGSPVADEGLADVPAEPDFLGANSLVLQNATVDELASSLPSKRKSADVEPEDGGKSTVNVAVKEVTEARVHGRKKARIQIDSRIQLSDDEMKNSRSNYLNEQGRLKIQLKYNKRVANSSAVLLNMMRDFPRGFVAPQLRTLWTTKMQTLVANNSHSEDNDEMPIYNADHVDIGEGQNLVDDDFRGGDMAIDDLYMDDAVMPDQILSDVERGRAESTRSNSLMAGGNSSLGGRHHTELSRSDNFAPWDLDVPSSSVAAPFEFDFLSDNPFAPSRFTPDGSILEINDHGVLLGDQSEDMQRPRILAGSNAHGQGVAAYSTPAGDLERQSYKFLEWVRMNLNVLPVGSLLTFSKLLTPDTSRRVAADAFYHVLVLSSKGVFCPIQREPHGQIEITLH